MELFYYVIIGILGMMLAYWLGRRSKKNENYKKFQQTMVNNNKEYRESEMKLRGIKKELIDAKKKIDNSDIVKDAESKAERILNEAQEKADKLENDASVARKNMLKEIEALRGLIDEKVKKFIDGNKPITAQENLNKLLKKPKGNKAGTFSYFRDDS